MLFNQRKISFNGLKMALFRIQTPKFLSTMNLNIQNKMTDRGVLIFQAFKQYKEKVGSCEIKFNFKVPLNSSDWPKNMHGLRLGRIMERIKKTNSLKDIHPSLTSLGFNIDPYIEFEVVAEALNKFKELEGHVQVPCDFRVPLDDLRYPEHLRGLELGFVVNNIQMKGIYEEQRDKLKEMGVNFEIKSPGSVNFDTIYSAAVAFKKTRGNLDVPVNFVAPYGLLEYPENTWGLELGKALLYVRTKSLHADNKHKLIARGFVDSVKPKPTFVLVYSALKAYKSTNGDLMVPQRFVVPQHDTHYSPETWV